MTHFQKENLLTTQLVFKCEILGCVKQQWNTNKCALVP